MIYERERGERLFICESFQDELLGQPDDRCVGIFVIAR